MSTTITVAATAEEARDITTRLRSSIDQTFLLVHEAHERKVWKVLGYRNWGDYSREELDMSRSRSYQLLRQAGIVRGAIEALSVSTNVDNREVAKALPEGAVREIAGYESALDIRLRWWSRGEDETIRDFTAGVLRSVRDDIAEAPYVLKWLDAERAKPKSEDEIARHAAFLRQLDIWSASIIIAAGGSEEDWRTFLATYVVPVKTVTDVVRWRTLAGMEGGRLDEYISTRAFVGADPHG